MRRQEKWPIDRCFKPVMVQTEATVDDDIVRWSDCIDVHGFRLTIRLSHTAHEMVLIEVLVESIDGSIDYALLADYQLVIYDKSDGHIIFVDREKVIWHGGGPQTLFDHRLSTDVSRIITRVRIARTLSAQNLFVESAYRDFAILVGARCFYVDTRYLAEHVGGALFDEWRTMHTKGMRRCAIVNYTTDEIALLLDAMYTYRSPIVTIDNYEPLLALCTQLKIARALRAIEQFLIDAVTVHPIRKLELAAEHRLALLATSVLRSFRCGVDALDSLHEYLRITDETSSLANVHPDVLATLNIFTDYLVL